jgi:CPA1 family monovalent cation:H+ antiporter
VLVLRTDAFGWLAALAVLLVLAARFLSVTATALALGRWTSFIPGTIPVLTWGGPRGGISIALALSIPEVPERSAILAATYIVVVFTIVIQGLTLRQINAPHTKRFGMHGARWFERHHASRGALIASGVDGCPKTHACT